MKVPVPTESSFSSDRQGRFRHVAMSIGKLPTVSFANCSIERLSWDRSSIRRPTDTKRVKTIRGFYYHSRLKQSILACKSLTSTKCFIICISQHFSFQDFHAHECECRYFRNHSSSYWVLCMFVDFSLIVRLIDRRTYWDLCRSKFQRHDWRLPSASHMLGTGGHRAWPFNQTQASRVH